MSLEYESTEDIQYDLAMFIADNDTDNTLVHDMYEELKNRNEKMPVGCIWSYSPYASFKKKLTFSLE